MRGTAIEMNRSRNSYIRAPRSVTLQPTAIPSRRLKFAIAFLARVTTGCWPVMAASSATAASSPWVLGRVAHADVEHDLLEPRNLVRVLERKLLLQLAPHLLLVEVPQPGPRRGLDRLLGHNRFSLRLLFGSLGLLGLLLLLRLLLLGLLFLLFFVCHTYLTRGIG